MPRSRRFSSSEPVANGGFTRFVPWPSGVRQVRRHSDASAILESLDSAVVERVGRHYHHLERGSGEALWLLILHSIVQMSKGLGKHTIAEFVGDAATVEALKDSGVDYAQGFYLGKPRPVSEALSL